MRKTKIPGKILGIGLVLAIIGAAGLTAPLKEVQASPGTIRVPGNYTTIQAAVNAASPGDTIIVRDGAYNENIDVNKGLTIRSENGTAKCVVSAVNPNDHVFYVTASQVSIVGFTVKDATGLTSAGIYVRKGNNGNISNNDVSNNRYGIYVFSSTSNVVTNNNVGNNDYGICLDSSSSNILTDNIAGNNDCGIYLKSSSQNTITGNEANSNNGCGIWLRYSNDSLITNNNASNNANDGIRLDSSHQNTLTSNTAMNNRYGIYLASSGGNTLTDNNVSNKLSGIRLDSSPDNTLTGNKANSNPGHGIWLYSSPNNTLTDNNASGNGIGIYLHYSANNTLINNTMSGNIYNFYVSGNSLSQYNHSIDTTNKVDGKSIYYWVNHRDERVPGDAGFVGVVNSTNITVRDFNLTKNGQGVLFAYTEHSVVANVTVSNNYQDGIRLSYSRNNTIINNTASNNYRGIHLHYSRNNTITHNNVNRNTHYGINLVSSINNTIYLNNFMDNTGNVYSSNSTNAWNPAGEINYACNGSTHENYLGNHWSDYSGSDPDGDGVGNSPYNILGCCPPDSDSYSLMAPFENYQPVPYATPPAEVIDLAVSETTASSITLTWTAPGDDGNSGTASRYDIRYSTSVIDEASWDLASQCAGEPQPQPAGSRETFTLTKRSSGTTYYLALKTADEVPVWSQLSNVATGTTVPGGGGGAVPPPPPAEFIVTSLDLSSKQVKPGEPVTVSAEVTNAGGSEGNCTLNLTINGEVEQTKTVTLAPQATKTVAFTVTREEAGSYSVSLDGLTDEFIVIAPRPSRYWWAIIAGIIAAGLLIHFLGFRRGRARLTTAK